MGPCLCCTVGDEAMDRGQAGEERKQLPSLCYIWSSRGWLVWEREPHNVLKIHECVHVTRFFFWTAEQKQMKA